MMTDQGRDNHRANSLSEVEVEHDLHLWGIDHHSAPTSIREQAYMDKDKVTRFLERCSKEEGIVSAVPLCTCNRTELYIETIKGFPLSGMLTEALHDVNIDFALFEGEHGLRLSGPKAVAHLYRVSSGLESMMLGESEITHQVKDAYRLARELLPLGPVLIRAFEGSFRAGKRVRSQTGISKGAVSVAFAAVELARKFFADLGNNTALLVGAGETGTLAARHLMQQGIGRLIVVNRSRDRAERLVEDLQPGDGCVARVEDFAKLGDAMQGADLVLTATESPEPLILPDMVKGAISERKGKPFVLFDIAVPRDVHEDVRTGDSVYLFGLDDLDAIVNANLSARRKEVERADRIIEHEVSEFERWIEKMALQPTVRQLGLFLDKLKERELTRVKHDAPEGTKEAVEKSLQGFIKTLMGQSLFKIKSARSPEERYQNMLALRRLFDRDDPEDPDRS